jgi:hypothetical protein
MRLYLPPKNATAIQGGSGIANLIPSHHTVTTPKSTRPEGDVESRDEATRVRARGSDSALSDAGVSSDAAATRNTVPPPPRGPSDCAPRERRAHRGDPEEER